MELLKSKFNFKESDLDGGSRLLLRYAPRVIVKLYIREGTMSIHFHSRRASPSCRDGFKSYRDWYTTIVSTTTCIAIRDVRSRWPWLTFHRCYHSDLPWRDCTLYSLTSDKAAIPKGLLLPSHKIQKLQYSNFTDCIILTSWHWVAEKRIHRISARIMIYRKRTSRISERTTIWQSPNTFNIIVRMIHLLLSVARITFSQKKS